MNRRTARRTALLLGAYGLWLLLTGIPGGAFGYSFKTGQWSRIDEPTRVGPTGTRIVGACMIALVAVILRQVPKE